MAKKLITDHENTPKSHSITKSNETPEQAKKILFQSTPNSMQSPSEMPSNRKRKLPFTLCTPIKLNKTNDLSKIEEISEISYSDISHSMNPLLPFNPLWIPNLHLTEDDRNILVNNGKLNSQHMEAVNILLKQKCSDTIGGFQLTEKVPVFDNANNKWTTHIPFQPRANELCCQIHHNHNDHWVLSVKYKRTIYLIDSLGLERPDDRLIPDGLKIQLSQIYGNNKKFIDITLPAVVKQENNYDCGLYAIAHATSFCLRQRPSFDLTFDSHLLRSHLISCFEEGELSEFPLAKKSIKTSKKATKKIKIENFCDCNLPSCVGDMVQCDECALWFHKDCVNAPADVSQLEYLCHYCG